MTVFVVQDSPGKNLTPAMKYGRLKVLCPFGDRPFSIEGEVRRIYEGLQTYCASNDYILPIGDPVLIGIATALAAEITDGRVRFLKYDRQERKYIPVAVNFPLMINGVVNGK